MVSEEQGRGEEWKRGRTEDGKTGKREDAKAPEGINRLDRQDDSDLTGGRMEGGKTRRLSESQITLIKGFHGTRIVGTGPGAVGNRTYRVG